MATALAQATFAAHKAATSLLSASQVTTGSTISTKVGLKDTAPDKTFTLDGISGKNIIVGVPGAFTGPCNAHVPGYIQNYEQFKAKGVKDIYIVAVNDVFVVQAWKQFLAPSGSPVRFVSDDTGSFLGSMGLLFDPTERLGGPRSKRFALIVEGDKITYIGVEPDPTKATVSSADAILAAL